MKKVFEFDFRGRKLIVENGRLYLLNEMVMDANHVSGY